MRVLLLHPPGVRTYLRDGYCSHSAKTAYLYHPLDLIAQSGWMSERFEVSFLDGIAERLDADGAYERILAARPDAIIFLTGAVSYREDFALLERVKARLPHVVMAGMGDILLWDAAAFVERTPWLDAALLDFTSPRLAEALAAGTAEGVLGPDPFAREAGRTFSYPVPRYDLFPMHGYRMPYGRPEAFGSPLTSFGCPYRCSYCNTATMRYRTRDLDGLAAELDEIHARGLRKVYVRDPTFGLNRRYTDAVLDDLVARRDEGRGFAWSCFTRADLVTPERAERMRAAGCYLVQLGIETASDELHERYGKDITAAAIREGVAALRGAGIEVLGTFVLGLPGETRATAEATSRFARELALDYASFNVATPRVGSALRDELGLPGVLEGGTAGLDSSNEVPRSGALDLDPDEVWRLRNRAIRGFYLRPGYLARRLARSWREGSLGVNARSGARLLLSALG